MSDGPDVSHDLKENALFFHRHPRPGKLEIQATKPLGNQRDLALAYSPGVAAACEAIAADPAEAATLTIRAEPRRRDLERHRRPRARRHRPARLEAGDGGQSRPVQEIRRHRRVRHRGGGEGRRQARRRGRALEPTFGGINLEDIKAPECFEVEERCKARMGIPVFHDDQHGTAIIVGAAVLNGLELAGKRIEDVKIVTSGAGAAALACLNILVSLGARRENIWVTDIEGVVYEGRAKLMDRWKSVYAQKTEARALADVIAGADVFLGLSAGGVLKPDMLKTMAPQPLVLALANPNPEIMPDAGAGDPARRHDLHRALGLPEPGQ